MSQRILSTASLRLSGSGLLLIGFVLLVMASSIGLGGAQLVGAAGDVGVRDFSFGYTQPGWGDPNNGPTGEKPQSKLWFNDGSWWGILYNSSAGAYHIYQFSWASQAWSDTGAFVDARWYSHADALWDGSHLYVATAAQPSSGNTDTNARLLRFSYNPTAKSYSLDAGFPVVLATIVMEAIVLDKDTTGMLWVTYTADNGQGGRNLYVTHTTTSDTSWVTPFVPSVTGANNLTTDDISAVVAFSGQIGVMWSNQTPINGSTNMFWITHKDGDPDNVWAQNPALQGPSYADDHINLKSLQADASGQVFAAVKTSVNDVSGQSPSAPLVLLLYLDQNGSWNRRTFGTVADNHTRPMVLIDNEHRNLYMFATTNNGDPPSAIYYKVTSLDNINFVSGLGTPFMQSSTDTNINNATSKKGSVSSQTGLLVLASDLTTGNYWHNTINLANPAATATSTPLATATTIPAATATPLPTSTSTSAPTPTPTTVSTSNLALNRPATASSIESTSYLPGYAFDGNTGTRWSSQFSDPQWIQVDLGSTALINQVKLYWEAAYATAYQIQVSNDATNWTTVYSTTSGAGGTQTLSVSGSGRYVRLYGTARATIYGYSIWEFQVYGTYTSPTNTPTPTATSTPVAGTDPPTPAPTATAVPATATALPTSTPTAMPTSTSPSYSSVVLSDTPVSYWRLGESSGTAAQDSADGNNGSIQAGVTLGAPGAIAGDSNTAMGFNGSTGSVQFADSSNLDFTEDFSVEAWAKPGTLDSTARSVVMKGGNTMQYSLGLNSAGQWTGSVSFGGKVYSAVSPGGATSGSWTYLALTRSRGTLTLYVDGVGVATTSTPSGKLSTTTSTLAIGRNGANSSGYFNGSIDEVAMYKSALSAARVLAHYKSGTGTP